MRPFTYTRAATVAAATRAFFAEPPNALVQGRKPVEYLAGGTTLLDLMKLDVMQPATLIDLNGIGTLHTSITVSERGLFLGALVKMSTAANHPQVAHDFPVIAQSLQLAASAQLRNMVTLGGNVLQRTRCPYFRDPGWMACNKRSPRSGCAALQGSNRQHAVLGGGDDCIATYPGDFAQALIALDSIVELAGVDGARRIPFESLHRRPASSPHVETAMLPGELITGFHIHSAPWMKRSLYLKIRDRQSYEFALASAAIALDIKNNVVQQARIALGGVATVPWRAKEAERTLIGKPLTETTAGVAAHVAFLDSIPRTHNAFKITLGQATVVRALLQAADLEV